MKPYADLVLAAWIVFAGVVYFAPVFVPKLGTMTWQLGVIYIIMLIFSLVYAYINRTARNEGEPSRPPVN